MSIWLLSTTPVSTIPALWGSLTPHIGSKSILNHWRLSATFLLLLSVIPLVERINSVLKIEEAIINVSTVPLVVLPLVTLTLMEEEH